MKKFTCKLIALILCISYTFMLVGCESYPLAKIIIANEQYNNKASLEEAEQPTELSKDTDVYVCRTQNTNIVKLSLCQAIDEGRN